MTDIPQEVLDRWEHARVAEDAIQEIRVVISNTTQPGCFGGLAYPGMDYPSAMEKICKIADDYRKEIGTE